MLTALLRPVARAQLSRIQAELDHLPHPTDAPQYHAPGPDPDRVLIFGNGPAIGFGVRTQELALPGQVGRRLARATGRGADIDLVARRRTSVELAAALVDGLRTERYDGLVVVLGATDAAGFLPARRWRAAMTELLGRLADRATPGAPIIVLGIHSLRRSALTSGALGDLIDDHARRLNAATRELCAQQAQFVYVDRDDVRTATVAYQSAQAFELLADMIVPALVPGLEAMAAGRTAARAVRNGEQPEAERQAAVEALGLLGTAPEERFDRIARSARSTFGTEVAGLSLIDGDRAWYKSLVGGPEAAPRESPRRVAVCDLTVRAGRALVIGDLASDPRTHPDLLRAGFRFYAGYPVESPDGYRVGALCVLDTQPRAPEDVDTELLRELALRVQRELWLQPDGRMRAG